MDDGSLMNLSSRAQNGNVSSRIKDLKKRITLALGLKPTQEIDEFKSTNSKMQQEVVEEELKAE